MLSYNEWKKVNETTSAPINNEPLDPDDNDWQYYHTKIQGRAKMYLDRFVNEIERRNLSLVKKAFILQEVMEALGMNIGQYVRVFSNIKRSLQKRQAMQTQPLQNQPPIAPQMMQNQPPAANNMVPQDPTGGVRQPSP